MGREASDIKVEDSSSQSDKAVFVRHVLDKYISGAQIGRVKDLPFAFIDFKMFKRYFTMDIVNNVIGVA